MGDVARLVEESLEEKEATDQLLSELAETEVNTMALEGASGPSGKAEFEKPPADGRKKASKRLLTYFPSSRVR